MVAGLEEVAKRAEKLEAREEAKRRAGGKMDASVGLHVDERGQRWKRRVNVGLAVAAVLVLASLALMIYSTVSQTVDPRERNAEAQKMLVALAGRASRPDFFKEGETVTAEKAREKLKEDVEAAYQAVLDQITINQKNNPYRRADASLAKEKEWIEKLRLFQDGWGQPFVFEIDGDNLKISAIGKKTAKATPPEPVLIHLRSGPAAPGKTGP